MTPSPSGQTNDRKEILAASAPWLAALLNVLPGLGTGYIYQRRWRAYWLTALLTSGWVGLEALLAQPGGAEMEPGAPILGLLALAMVSAVEAFLAARRARMN